MLKGRRAHIIPIGLLLTVMLMVFGGGSAKGQQPCGGATTQESATSGCILCGIDDPLFSVDANLTNATRINLGVGVGAVGYQRLIFTNPGLSGDKVVIELETTVDLLTLTLANSGTVQLKNGTIASGASYSFRSTSLNLELINSKRFKLTIPAVAAFDRIEVNIGGTLTVLSSIKIYGAEIIYQTPTISSTNQTICSGSTATLTATASAGSAINWYSTATGGTATATPTFTTPTLTATIIFYVEAVRACVKSTRIPVIVNVNSVTGGTIGSDRAICSNTSPGTFTSLAAAAAGGTVNYQWQKSSDNTSFTNISEATNETYLESNVINQRTYYRRAATYILNSVSCTNYSNTITVTVNPLPTISLGSIVDVCQGITSGSLPYSATTGSPTTYKIVWKTAASTAGFIDVPYTTLTSSPITFPVPINPAVAIYTGSVIVKNVNTCESIAIDFNITIHPKLPQPHINITANQ